MHLEEGLEEGDVDRWAQAASVLHSNGDAMDIAVKDHRIVGVRGRAGDRVNHGRLDPKDLCHLRTRTRPGHVDTKPIDPGTVAAMSIPFITVRHPRSHDIVDDPVEVAGVGTGFEGTLSARLRNAAGQELAEKSFQAGGTGIWGNFFFRIDVPGVPSRARGTLEVFEVSAEDGSELHKRVIPILFGRALVDPFLGFAVHTVRVGETLSGIANEVYGDPAKFRTIFAANREVLDDPDVIVPGQVLRIPQ
jgi:Immunoglobulin-like domain of bacterial spore germination/LysM domain